MKNTILLLSLVLSQVALANPQRDKKAIAAFNAAPAVKAELLKLEAKKIGEPIALEVAGMGDGCEYMAGYLVVQKVKGNSFAQKTIAARVSLSEIFYKDCGENKPNEIIATFESLVDLNVATQPNP